MVRISSDGVPVEGARDDLVAARVLPVRPFLSWLLPNPPGTYCIGY